MSNLSGNVDEKISEQGTGGDATSRGIYISLQWNPERSKSTTLKSSSDQWNQTTLPNCIHYVTGQFGEPDEVSSEMIAQSTATPFADLHSKTLKVHCINVKQAFRRRGLGSAMVKNLVDWASAQGWERIEGSAFLRGDWGWLPNIEFWEKAGFTRGTKEESTLEFGPGVGFRMDLKSKPLDLSSKTDSGDLQ